MNKKSQAWGLDFFIGVLIFIFGILSFFLYVLNSSDFNDEEIEKISLDADYISYSLISEGYPANWNESNVLAIGLMNQNSVDPLKLEKFYNLVNQNYNGTKSLFKTQYDYYISFNKPLIINGTPVSGIGNIYFNLNESGTKNLIKIDRFVNYNDEFITIHVYVWGA